tara:strand:+ start:1531 stop:1920 length:390 start_codon:yes stop_codon:yes gene_type:complete
MNSQILKGFNDHFMEMVEDIERVFPDDTDISTVKNSFTELRKANPKMVIKVYKEQILDLYRSQIESGNIDFFIDKDYKKDIGNIQDSEYILNKINILRDPVRDMEKADQDKVIHYIQNLSKLCDAYHNK